jgi:uncharacterized protein YegJ (DUF2314 family)
MSDSESSPVFMFDNSDPEMQEAYEKARATFRYFWREVAWENRRIIPALDMASVKAPFSDGKTAKRKADDETPEVEHMWISEIEFDGRHVSGVLLNDPNWLKSVKQGDSVRIPVNEISDWMYVINGEVMGAYTVNLMRSRMGPQERREHDGAWGLNFGDPSNIRLVPEPEQSGGFLKRMFGKRPAASADPVESREHPMSEAMAEKLKEQLAADKSLVHSTGDQGWTLLHQEALAGSLPTVKVLLEAGADPNAQTNHGMTPLQLAHALGWEKVVTLLLSKGARGK